MLGRPRAPAPRRRQAGARGRSGLRHRLPPARISLARPDRMHAKRHLSAQMVERAREKVAGAGRHSAHHPADAGRSKRRRRQGDSLIWRPRSTPSPWDNLVDPVEPRPVFRQPSPPGAPGRIVVFVDHWNAAKMATQFSPHRERSVEHDGLQHPSRLQATCGTCRRKNALEVHFIVGVRDPVSGRIEALRRKFTWCATIRRRNLTNLFLAHGFRVVEAKPTTFRAPRKRWKTRGTSIWWRSSRSGNERGRGNRTCDQKMATSSPSSFAARRCPRRVSIS